MDTHNQKFKVRLGLFIFVGLGIFVIAIFIIGKQAVALDQRDHFRHVPAFVHQAADAQAALQAERTPTRSAVT